MLYRFETTQWLPYPLPQVFAFFANPANLPRLMPDWQDARIDAITLIPPPNPPRDHASTPAAGAGTRMTLTFRPVPFSPFRLAWDAEIAEFAWNDHFCDIQLQRGPFAHWRHCHSVREQHRDGREGTLLRDHLQYELPLAPLSNIANALFVRRQIEAIFAFRQKRTAELLSGTP